MNAHPTQPRGTRPFPLLTATLVSYAIASAVSIGDGSRSAWHADVAPTPYSADHAHVLANAPDEEQPPTF